MSKVSTQAGHGSSAILPARLAICVTFHFVQARLPILSRTVAWFSQLAPEVDVAIITNARGESEQQQIRDALHGHGFAFRILTPGLLGHPYLLTWCHLDVFRDRLACDPAITHFMYLEDDILVTPANMAWWLRAREQLRPWRAIPSFLRYELRRDCPDLLSTDVTRPLSLNNLPRIAWSKDYAFVNLPLPYQGMYLLDRDLMQEHLSGPSSSPDHGRWAIRERATQGLTFTAIPQGCTSRNFVGYCRDEGHIDLRCLIHHLPNNYANDPDSPHGKVRVIDLLRQEAAAAQDA